MTPPAPLALVHKRARPVGLGLRTGTLETTTQLGLARRQFCLGSGALLVGPVGWMRHLQEAGEADVPSRRPIAPQVRGTCDALGEEQVPELAWRGSTGKSIVLHGARCVGVQGIVNDDVPRT